MTSTFTPLPSREYVTQGPLVLNRMIGWRRLVLGRGSLTPSESPDPFEITRAWDWAESP